MEGEGQGEGSQFMTIDKVCIFACRMSLLQLRIAVLIARSLS